jgi:hypothetical protein
MTQPPNQDRKRLLKPQYSLRWVFVELTLTAVAVGCFAYFIRNPNLYRPDDILLPFFGFFAAAGCAVGGLAHCHLIGGFVGLVIAGSMWPFLLRGLS